MINLLIDKTAFTPSFDFNTNGELHVKGISTPDNVQKFYQPIFDWLKSFIDSKPSKINFVMEIDYLNTSSSRIFVELLMLISSAKANGTQTTIVWKYEDEDEDMLELGQDLQESSKAEVVFEAVKVD